jgi:hypothetical protein
MRGGTIRVHGDAGHLVGPACPGADEGGGGGILLGRASRHHVPQRLVVFHRAPLQLPH